MKNKKYFAKALSVALGLVCTVGAFGGCGKKEEEHPVLPTYAAKDYDFFAYSGPMSGTFIVDGIEQELGPDQRTVEGYTTFKEAGFTMAMLSASAGLNAMGDTPEEWAAGFPESECFRTMKAAYAAGIDRIIVSDSLITGLIEKGDKLVTVKDAEGNVVSEGTYESEEALKDYVKSRMAVYYQTPGFYGINLRDEPPHEMAQAYGWVYKAVKAAAAELGMADVYIHMNLLPLTGTLHTDEYKNAGKSMYEAYVDYIDKYLKYSGSTRISIDVYAFRESGITGAFYPTIQIALDKCKEYGAELTFCTQSFELLTDGGGKAYRGIGKSEMMLELYSLMGMGLDDFAYFTYQPMENHSSLQATWGDYTFLNAKGEKNNVYYYGQEVMANAQAMSDVILNYEYQGGYFFMKDVPTFPTADYLLFSTSTSMAQFHNDHVFNESVFKGVEYDNDIVFVTELKDEANGLWMYMVQNVLDPINGKDGRTAEHVKVTFDSSYTWVAELKDGRIEYVKLNGGVYEKTLSAGHAVYLVPLK